MGRLTVLLMFFMCNILFSQYRIENWVAIDSVKSMDFLKIRCFDSCNCISGAFKKSYETIIKRTTDSGRNWDTVFSDTIKAGYWDENGLPHDIEYLPANRIIDIAYPAKDMIACLLTNNNLVVSSDGVSYKTLKWDSTILLADISMTDKYSGIISGDYGVVITHDGWNTYKKILPCDLSTGIIFYKHFMLNEEIIYLTAYMTDTNNKTRILFKTNDGGNSWIHYEFNGSFENFCFADENNGWGCTYRQKSGGNSCYDVIFYTNDGGKTWVKQLDTLSNKISGLSDISFINEKEGIAIGWAKTVYKTTNGGAHWEMDIKEPMNKYWSFFRDLEYVDKNHIYISELGSILKYDPLGNSVEMKYFEPKISLSPNPLYPGDALKLSFTLESACKVSVSLFDELGVPFGNIYQSSMDAGTHTLHYSETVGLPSGIYFLRITANGKVWSEKVAVVR